MASEKEKLTGALSRIRTCDPPLRRRMLYPTELPGHRDIVPEPKESPINVQPVPSKTSRERDVKPEPKESPINVQPVPSKTSRERDVKPEPMEYPTRVQPVHSQQPARKGPLTQNPQYPINITPFPQPITSQERATIPESKVSDLFLNR